MRCDPASSSFLTSLTEDNFANFNPGFAREAELTPVRVSERASAPVTDHPDHGRLTARKFHARFRDCFFELITCLIDH
jgi:hypothetical protein